MWQLGRPVQHGPQVCMGLHGPVPTKTVMERTSLGTANKGRGKQSLYPPPASGAKIYLAALIFMVALHLFLQGLLSQPS